VRFGYRPARKAKAPGAGRFDPASGFDRRPDDLSEIAGAGELSPLNRQSLHEMGDKRCFGRKA
jgi:hypothetical protein